jgi:hypothetical protein
MGIRQRLPDWFQDDLLVTTLTEVFDERKLTSYYNYLRRNVKQPLQIWGVYDTKNLTWEQNYINDIENEKNNITITYDRGYPAHPIIEIINVSGVKKLKNVTGPIVIETNNSQYIVDVDLPYNSTLTITPESVRLNGKDITYKKINNNARAIIKDFGNLSSNKKFRQYFTLDTEIDYLKFSLKVTNPLPTADILVDIVDAKNNQYIHSKMVAAKDIQKYDNIYNVTIQPDKKIKPGEYYIEFKLSGVYGERTYYQFYGTKEKVFNSYLMVFQKIGEEYDWVKADYNLYIEFYKNRTSGTYPVIYPQQENKLTITAENFLRPATEDEMLCFGDTLEGEPNIEDGKACCDVQTDLKIKAEITYLKEIKARIMAERTYPIKSIAIYLDNGKDYEPDERLYYEKFKLQHYYTCKEVTVSLENKPLILPQYFYVVGEWHYFEAQKKVGFPVSRNSEKILYRPNKALDLHGEQFKIPRRKYKKEIPYHYYSKTFPVGYIFDTEQDYWYEQRLLEEYYHLSSFTPYYEEYTLPDYHYYSDPLDDEQIERPDYIRKSIKAQTATYVNKYIAKNANQEILYVISTKKVFYKPILVNFYKEEEGRYSLRIYNQEMELIEKYENLEPFELQKNVNEASNYIRIKFKKIEDFPSISIELFTDGYYKKNGLLASEIYHQTSQLPHIKNMWEYCVIYDRKGWDNALWSGAFYSEGCFRAEIPCPLPANVIKLGNTQLNKIIDRCKKIGTAGISSYWYHIGKIEYELTYESEEPEIKKPELIYGPYILQPQVYHGNWVTYYPLELKEHYNSKTIDKIEKTKYSMQYYVRTQSIAKIEIPLMKQTDLNKNYHSNLTVKENYYTMMQDGEKTALLITPKIVIPDSWKWNDITLKAAIPQNTKIQTSVLTTVNAYNSGDSNPQKIELGNYFIREIQQELPYLKNIRLIELEIEKINNPTDKIQLQLITPNGIIWETTFAPINGINKIYLPNIKAEENLRLILKRTGDYNSNNFYKITTVKPKTAPIIVKSATTTETIQGEIKLNIYTSKILTVSTKTQFKIDNIGQKEIFLELFFERNKLTTTPTIEKIIIRKTKG